MLACVYVVDNTLTIKIFLLRQNMTELLMLKLHTTGNYLTTCWFPPLTRRTSPERGGGGGVVILRGENYHSRECLHTKYTYHFECQTRRQEGLRTSSASTVELQSHSLKQVDPIHRVAQRQKKKKVLATLSNLLPENDVTSTPSSLRWHNVRIFRCTCTYSCGKLNWE